jgi:hypothetical protein
MKAKKQKPCRQGDVLVLPIDSFPEGLVRTKKVTLALGEVTGHHHTIHNGAIGYADEEDQLAEYFEVFENAELTHQEHDAITFRPGKYRNVIQVQYTPEALVRVAD